jgi:hypothetical protein
LYLSDIEVVSIKNLVSGHSSVVERNLAKVDVARSNRVARFKLQFLDKNKINLAPIV